MTPAPELDNLTDDALQTLLDRVVSCYSARVENAVETGAAPLAALPEQRVSSATDVVIAANMLLRACGLSPFELSLLSRY